MNLGDSRAQSQAQTISHEKHHCDAGEDACFSALHASITGSYSLAAGDRSMCKGTRIRHYSTGYSSVILSNTKSVLYSELFSHDIINT